MAMLYDMDLYSEGQSCFPARDIFIKPEDILSARLFLFLWPWKPRYLGLAINLSTPLHSGLVSLLLWASGYLLGKKENEGCVEYRN